MGVEHAAVITRMVAKLLTAPTWLRIDQDIIDTLSTTLIL